MLEKHGEKLKKNSLKQRMEKSDGGETQSEGEKCQQPPSGTDSPLGHMDTHHIAGERAPSPLPAPSTPKPQFPPPWGGHGGCLACVCTPRVCVPAREGAAHDLNVRRVPHALRGDICVRVDTTCLGPDKSHLIDTEKGADKRPSGAGERCTMLVAGTTRKGGGIEGGRGERGGF